MENAEPTLTSRPFESLLASMRRNGFDHPAAHNKHRENNPMQTQTRRRNHTPKAEPPPIPGDTPRRTQSSKYSAKVLSKYSDKVLMTALCGGMLAACAALTYSCVLLARARKPMQAFVVNEKEEETPT